MLQQLRYAVRTLLYHRVAYSNARDPIRVSEQFLPTNFNNIRSIAQGNYAEAESLFQRALTIKEKVLGPEHPEVATSINNLAMLLKIQVRNPVVRFFAPQLLQGRYSQTFKGTKRSHLDDNANAEANELFVYKLRLILRLTPGKVRAVNGGSDA